MIALESLAALVTILGGIVAVIIWLLGRIAVLKKENDELYARLQSLATAPQQPANADYLVDADGNRLCIRCYNTSQARWKLLQDGGAWKCPVCGSESRHDVGEASSTVLGKA